jgi:hypothetical protein
MISVLIWILVCLIIFAIVIYIIKLLPIPQPWLNIAIAIVALIFLLILLAQFGVIAGGPVVHLR